MEMGVGSIVIRRETYEAPKIGFGAVSRRSPRTRRCVGCAGARARARISWYQADDLQSGH
jgi:hypothetical protein